MKRNNLTGRVKKAMLNLVEKEPDFSMELPLFLYRDNYQKLDFLAHSLNRTPHDDPAYDTIIPKIEALATQTLSKKDWIEGKSKFPFGLGSPEFHPSKENPLFFFNDLAKWILFRFEFVGYENKDGNIEVHASHHPVDAISIVLGLEGGSIPSKEGMKSVKKSANILWHLWEIYFRKIGLERLKRCPQCKKWFVDRTRNNKKERCSPHCTWQYWSWDRRKESKQKFLHEVQKKKIEKIYCEVRSRYFYNDELCLYLQKKVPNPNKVCKIKCDYYKSLRKLKAQKEKEG